MAVEENNSNKMDKTYNEVNEIRAVMNAIIIKRKIKLMGDLLRHDRFITMEGEINGKRIRGRPYKSFFTETV